ncbi:MAG: hypothetical protein HN509_13970 [Halobacteriovoraceae bacterium]|jgi:hypothetical protein|nr:hypothetical protein [Halobacteriovoraceae bacterium]MBT5092956.1 hypothetical protein [Halobacteriovoraceae bacterium]
MEQSSLPEYIVTSKKWRLATSDRDRNSARMLAHPPERFETYQDWFFFSHIDPVQRFWHCLGMIIGTPMFLLLFYFWNSWSVLFYLLGVFFFYGFGVLSHLYYDGSKGRSEMRNFHLTTWLVIKINYWTFFGFYPKVLGKFVEKYPFTKEAFELEEVGA